MRPLRGPWSKPLLLLILSANFFSASPQALESQQRREVERLRLTYGEALKSAYEQYGESVSYRELVYGSIQGMTRGLDPHTHFLTPEAYKAMASRASGSYVGVGILVSRRDGHLVIIAPIEGTPGARAGLLPGDMISHVDGKPTEDLTLLAAVSLIKGPKGTRVTLTVRRRGLAKPLEIELPRAEIPQETVRYAYMMTPGTGYLRLTDFTRSTVREFAEAMQRLREQGMNRLLLDLRSNGGGLVDAAVGVASHFVPQGQVVVETRGRLPNRSHTYRAEGDYPEWDMPLVVITNRGTASAAEILCGAIQDHDLGLVVGTATWGKALVQTVYNLSRGAGVALTTALYHTPSGRHLQRDFSSYYDYYMRADRNGGGVQGDSFRTRLGRLVYSGAGITPDVEVEPRSGPDVVGPLYARNAFMKFSSDFVRERGELSRDWSPGPEVLSEFEAWLKEEGVLDDPGVHLAQPVVAELVMRLIHSDVMNVLYGQEAAHRALAHGDRQIQRALDLFDDASELLRRRRGLR